MMTMMANTKMFENIALVVCGDTMFLYNYNCNIMEK